MDVAERVFNSLVVRNLYASYTDAFDAQTTELGRSWRGERERIGDSGGGCVADERE